jgi:hypothetical protein
MSTEEQGSSEPDGDTAGLAEALGSTCKPDGATRYRLREPVLLDAIEWTGSNEEAVRQFAGGYWDSSMPPCWVLRGVTGRLFTVDPDRFAATYEPADLSIRVNVNMPPLSPEAVNELRERFRAAFTANPFPAVLPPDRWKDRAEAAEAKLAAIKAYCDRPEWMRAAVDVKARILVIISGEETGNG